MKYQVPQFIEVEDKIFGPLTFKQFVYLAGGAGLSIIFYLLIPVIYISLLLIIPVMVFASALAFYKINNKPFIIVVEAAILYYFGSKLYIWRKEEPKAEDIKASDADGALNSSAFIPKLSNSKLKDLTWALDTKETLNTKLKEEAEV